LFENFPDLVENPVCLFLRKTDAFSHGDYITLFEISFSVDGCRVLSINPSLGRMS